MNVLKNQGFVGSIVTMGKSWIIFIQMEFGKVIITTPFNMLVFCYKSLLQGLLYQTLWRRQGCGPTLCLIVLWKNVQRQ